MTQRLVEQRKIVKLGTQTQEEGGKAFLFSREIAKAIECLLIHFVKFLPNPVFKIYSMSSQCLLLKQKIIKTFNLDF